MRTKEEIEKGLADGAYGWLADVALELIDELSTIKEGIENKNEALNIAVPTDQCVYVGLCIKRIEMPTKKKRARLMIEFNVHDDETVTPMLEALLKQAMGGLLAPVNIRGLRLVWKDYSAEDAK